MSVGAVHSVLVYFRYKIYELSEELSLLIDTKAEFTLKMGGVYTAFVYANGTQVIIQVARNRWKIPSSFSFPFAFYFGKNM